MKLSLTILSLTIFLNFGLLAQINIKSRPVVPKATCLDSFDEQGAADAMRSRNNSFDLNSNDIQNKINQTCEKLKNLEYVDEKRFGEISYSISSYINSVNANRLDISNAINKSSTDNGLIDINNTIDNVFRYNKEKIKIPVWIINRERNAWVKAYLISDPE